MAAPSPTSPSACCAGDKRALARAITLVEDDDPEGWELVREVYPHTGRAAVVGFTGPPGVGKSTLLGALTKATRAAGRKVAVLSIDPSSPFTQGALLGDRIRLTEHFLDPGVFIRSMANRGALGGLSEAALQAALLMDAAGRDDVLLETVGVGQAEVDIIDHADTVVLVLMPGSGDSIQALKAGIMEIPDVIVVNKADHPLTDTMVREIRGVLSLGAAARLARADRQDRGGPRRGRSRSWSSSSTRTARTSRRRARSPSAAGATCATRSLGDRHLPPAPRAGGVACARTPRSSGCSTRSSRAAWTRRARRPRCSSAGRTSAPVAGAAGLLAEQRADGLRLHRAQPLEQRTGRRRDVQRRGDRALPVGCRGGELHVAGEVAGVAVDRAAPGLVAEERQAGGVGPGPGGLDRPPGTKRSCSRCWAAVEEAQAQVARMKRVEVRGRRDDRARGPRAARAEEGRDVLGLLPGRVT